MKPKFRCSCLSCLTLDIQNVDFTDYVFDYNERYNDFSFTPSMFADLSQVSSSSIEKFREAIRLGKGVI